MELKHLLIRYADYFTGSIGENVLKIDERTRAHGLLFCSNMIGLVQLVHCIVGLVTNGKALPEYTTIYPISVISLLLIFPFTLRLKGPQVAIHILISTVMMINFWIGIGGVLSYLTPMMVTILPTIYGTLVGFDKYLLFYSMGTHISMRLQIRAGHRSIGIEGFPKLLQMMGDYERMHTILIVLILVCSYYNSVSRKVVEATLRKQIEKAEEALRSKEIFFASMSHELRNPLNSLLGCIDILSQNKKKEDREIAQIANNCGEVLLNLIGNILDVSKLAAGKVELQYNAENIKMTIEKILAISKGQAQAKGIKLSLTVEPKTPEYVEADHGRLTQVLINILGNAIKFTDDGEVRVHVNWISAEDATKINALDHENLFKTSFLLAMSDKERQYQRQESQHNSLPTDRDMDENIDSFDVRASFANSHNNLFQMVSYSPQGPHTPHEEIKARQMRRRSSGINELCTSQKIVQRKSNSSRSFINFEKLRSQNSISRLNTNRRKSIYENLDTPRRVRNEEDSLEGYLCITVTDTGIGISEEGIKKLFQQFSQAESNITSRFGGTGLGLWISQNIAHLMGGDIKVYSETGKGSSFVLIVPLKIGSVFKNQSSTLKFEKIEDVKRVLLVDDQKYNLTIIKGVLERHSFQVFTATNGLEGMNLLKQYPEDFFDTIITDINMPVMDGKEFIHNIRRDELKYEKKKMIMILTGNMKEEESIRENHYLGADSLMLKPFNLKKFMKFMEESKTECSSKKEPIRKETDRIVSFTQKKILLVDDDHFTSGLIANYLNVSGYECERVFNGKEATDAIMEDHSEYFLMLMDTNMPVMNGYEAVEHIRAFEKTNALPPLNIACISGYTDNEHLQSCQRLGFDFVFSKPLNKKEILRYVKDVVNKIHSENEKQKLEIGLS